MSVESTFEFPTITDGDIFRANQLMGLPDNAFYGVDGSDPRQDVLKRMDSIDVAACPGSGKTTLLVAKLAILAEKWKHNTRGICVISHTNAARNEIEKHLGSTAAGQGLLSYPHYIGTIHGFINEFLAMPWLRSLGYNIKMVDTEVCQRKRWMALPYKTRRALENNYHTQSILSVKDPEFRVGRVRWGRGGELGADTPTYKDIQRVCFQSAMEGYFCYDEMFMWAEHAIGSVAEIISAVRDRFPILFIDETQDNSKEQAQILNQIFMEGNNPVIRQRFGDSNQAIFDFQGAKEAVSDKFPGANKVALPNSHRFSQSIADIADPLGVVPYVLQGLGPKKNLMSGSQFGKHTIFIFEKGSVEKVIDAYGGLLLETFSDFELHEDGFVATAVGQVHKPPGDDANHKFPHHIGHYWPDYDPALAKNDPVPKTFIQYVFAGKAKSDLKDESHSMVEKVAEGFLRLADFTTDEKSPGRPKHQHRHILQVLESLHDARKEYLDLIACLIIKKELPTIESWNEHWCKRVRRVGEAIAGAPLAPEADSFLIWSDTPASVPTPAIAAKSRNNLFRYREDGREVFIQAGSIHSVKGQTHTATLVLDTFFHKHNLESLLPWLTGKKRGWVESAGKQKADRLKLHYVAMTRPTHLLCLAMSRECLDGRSIEALRDRGWSLLEVRSDGSTFLNE